MSRHVPDSLIARHFPLILAGPTGAGKTTLRDRLLAHPDVSGRLRFSVSMTTREPRAGEVAGVDYDFVDPDEFDRRVEQGSMLEWARVHERGYGTPRANLDRARDEGVHLLLDIDVQGARQVRAAVDDVVSIFVLPPDGRRVLERLRKRGSEDLAEIRRRFHSARAELASVREFDYLVVNDDLDTAVADVVAILEAEEHALRHLGERAEKVCQRLGSEIEAGLG